MVKDASGNPVAGAFVKLRNTEKRLGFMVISQDGGAFSAKQLPAGNYEVQSIGGDFQSKWSAPVAVPEQRVGQGRSGAHRHARARSGSRLAAAFAAGDRGDHDAARRAGQRTRRNALQFLPYPGKLGRTRRRRANSWHETVKEMRNFMKEAGMPEFTDHEEEVADRVFRKELGAEAGAGCEQPLAAQTDAGPSA